MSALLFLLSVLGAGAPVLASQEGLIQDEVSPTTAEPQDIDSEVPS